MNPLAWNTPTGNETRTLVLILAGGNGTRLGELTRWDAKPALPFGGQYRNIDFSLSNCFNSGMRRIAILTQYKAHSLIQHVIQGWGFLSPEAGTFVELWPAQQRTGKDWYSGTADAVYQNIDLIREHAPEHVVVLAGDHVYKMDYRPMLDAHIQCGADTTVSCIEVPLSEASAFGIVSVDPQGRVTRFNEKPSRPVPLPENPRRAMASMGIYIFNREFLVRVLMHDANRQNSSHDFGRDILPAAVAEANVAAYRFRNPATDVHGYWRDVGTVDSYWQANMDLLTDEPALDLYDNAWPIRTHQPQCPPARFGSFGVACSSIVSPGCSVFGTIKRSVLSMSCHVASGSVLESSVVLPRSSVGRNCRIHRTIIDSDCVVPDGMTIGFDISQDASRFRVSPSQIVLVTAEMIERMQLQSEREGSVAKVSTHWAQQHVRTEVDNSGPKVHSSAAARAALGVL